MLAMPQGDYGGKSSESRWGAGSRIGASVACVSGIKIPLGDLGWSPIPETSPPLFHTLTGMASRGNCSTARAVQSNCSRETHTGGSVAADS
jgi:hypothetical protein